MSLLTPILWILLLLPVLCIAYFQSAKGQLTYLLLFIAYFLTDVYVQILSRQLDTILGWHTRFAWTGKLASLLLAVVFILCMTKDQWKAAGFTTSTNEPSKVRFGVWVFLGFLAFDIVFKMILFPKGGQFNAETFAFQATMPGLTEEILFRGLYLWMLDKVFLPKWQVKGISFGWGLIIVTFFFGLTHGVVVTPDHKVKCDIITIVYLTLISAVSVGILRKFSGNVLYPILGHNAINLINATIRIL
ncbi:hypothetical protein LX64_05008 [Chitinophaga skermanii]|uniref:CAAX prenyl protease 2/Lysostaphin resistance protein A-like domain-containing protein n=1 Tax=Chitinophaga skermanii TaxID=331697 RepID=A0A327Q1F6_9BACT|nr:CPBP family intramembrane glutamic endopeptidase [Chitinophaga skermanii]RAI97704.1 hypothetical protein LX64_05008 [Chitinophaga skermanii]